MEEAQVPVPQSVAVAAATVAAATVAAATVAAATVAAATVAAATVEAATVEATVEAQAAVAALEDPLGIHSLAAPEVVVDSEAVPETRPRAFSRS
jgi:hypothetical protein